MTQDTTEERLPKPPHIPSSPKPVDLEGNVKLGVKTLIAVLISVILGTVTLVGLYYRLPTKEDLQSLQNDRWDTLQKLSAMQNRLGRVEEKQEEDQKAVGYIRARIDFLTEQAVRETVPTRKAGDKAVERLRSGEKPSDVIE